MKYLFLALSIAALQLVTTESAMAQNFQLPTLSILSPAASLNSISLLDGQSLSITNVGSATQLGAVAPGAQNTQMQIAMLQSQRRGKAGGVVLTIFGTLLTLVGLFGIFFISILLGSIVLVLGVGLLVGGIVLLKSASRHNALIDLQIQQLMMQRQPQAHHSTPVFELAF